MGTQTALTDPDYDRIRRESGPETEDAIRRLFLAASRFLLEGATSASSVAAPVITYIGDTNGQFNLEQGPLVFDNGNLGGSWVLSVGQTCNILVSGSAGGGGGGTDDGSAGTNAGASGGGGAQSNTLGEPVTLVPGKVYTVVQGARGIKDADGVNSSFVNTTDATTILRLIKGGKGNPQAILAGGVGGTGGTGTNNNAGGDGGLGGDVGPNNGRPGVDKVTGCGGGGGGGTANGNRDGGAGGAGVAAGGAKGIGGSTGSAGGNNGGLAGGGGAGFAGGGQFAGGGGGGGGVQFPLVPSIAADAFGGGGGGGPYISGDGGAGLRGVVILTLVSVP